ncbi:MAG TPA: hypothetical protein VFH66_12090 [Mycobacteriales bacterium]|nr:hypothetical protein [Mycobacteriales bacterium]
MTGAQPSPLGRYDDSTGDEPMHEVRLINMPVRLLASGRQHHDELMHEFAVLAVSLENRESVPARMLEMIDTLGTRYGRASDRPDALVDEAIARGDDTIDLTYQVPAHVVDAADALERMMAEADEFCRSEQMLTLSRSDVQKRFAKWYLEEFRRQVAGQPPQPWDGPIDEPQR